MTMRLLCGILIIDDVNDNDPDGGDDIIWMSANVMHVDFFEAMNSSWSFVIYLSRGKMFLLFTDG